MSDDINKLRELLFETMRDLRAGTIEVNCAKVINDTAQTIINSAKVEVEYIKATGAQTSNGFIESAEQPALQNETDLPKGILSVRRHILR